MRNYTNITNIQSVGTVTTCTVNSDVKENGFCLTSLRESGNNVIINKDEWHRFLKFCKVTKSNNQCLTAPRRKRGVNM